MQPASLYAGRELEELRGRSERDFFSELKDSSVLQSFSRTGNLLQQEGFSSSFSHTQKSYASKTSIQAYGSSPDGSVFLFIQTTTGENPAKEFILYSTETQSARIFKAENKESYQYIKKRLKEEHELGIPLLQESIPSQLYHFQNLPFFLYIDVANISPKPASMKFAQYNGHLYSISAQIEANRKRYAAFALSFDEFLLEPPSVKRVYYSYFSSALGCIIEVLKEQPLPLKSAAQQHSRYVKEEILVFFDLRAILKSEKLLLKAERDYKLSPDQQKTAFYSKTYFSFYQPSLAQTTFFHDGSRSIGYSDNPILQNWFNF